VPCAAPQRTIGLHAAPSQLHQPRVWWGKASSTKCTYRASDARVSMIKLVEPLHITLMELKRGEGREENVIRVWFGVFCSIVGQCQSWICS
jgi:hypothetical protein